MATAKRDTLPPVKVKISKSLIPNAGRGVFAARNIKKGELIETAPVLALPKKDFPLIKRTELRNYKFMWGRKKCAICFGYGSLYNHSYNPNATYKKRYKEWKVDFIAIKPIKKGEEITTNYNYGNPTSKKALWIKSIKPYSGV